MNLEVSLRVIACWAYLRSLLAYYDVSAVATFPYLHLALGEDSSCLHILQQGAVSLLVALLDGSYKAELSRKLWETLLLGCLGKTIVHVCPLVVLALSSCCKVLSRVANAIELLEPQLSVLLLVVCRLLEDGRDLLISFLLSLRSKVYVLVACLTFACESL